MNIARDWKFFCCRGVAASVLLAASAPVAFAQEIDATLGEQVFMIPAGGFSEPELEVTVFLPAGAGPFPVIVINHGRAPGNAKFQPRYRPVLAVREFIRRGYAVMAPMRSGFSKSGGSEISGGCNVYSNGIEQAAPQASGFAALADVDKLPLRGERAREGYREWLRRDGPRAFAIHPGKGFWAATSGGRRAIARVLARCETLAGEPCKLYAVDDSVVWGAQ